MRWVMYLALTGVIALSQGLVGRLVLAAAHVQIAETLWVDDDAHAGGDGSFARPYRTIQEAIDRADQTLLTYVYVRPGTYVGQANRDIDFRGKPIHLEGYLGASETTIDCQMLGRAFHFHNGEGPESMVQGFTIKNGHAATASAVLCERSCPTITECRFQNQMDSMVYLNHGRMRLTGLIEGEREGWFVVDANGMLELDQCQCSCNIRGAGRLMIPAGSWAVLEDDATVRMRPDEHAHDSGSIHCAGWLEVAGYAHLIDSLIHIVPSGLLFVTQCASVNRNSIHVRADDYMSVAPDWSEGSLADNKIHVTIEAGTTGQVFEARGRDLLRDPNYLQDAVPAFSDRTWTLERLELTEGARLNLADRFRDQTEPSDAEALYVKKLVLGPGAVLNVGANRLYCADVSDVDDTARITMGGTRRWPPSFLLGRMTFDDPDEYANRVVTNDFGDGAYATRVVGQQPDPAGMLRLSCDWLWDGAATVLLPRCVESTMTIQFDYLFTETLPGTELAVCISDVPLWMLEPGSPLRADHSVEVARVPVPPVGRPGSVGSGRFARFTRRVQVPAERIAFDLSQGTWVEFALLYPQAYEGLYGTSLSVAGAGDPAGSSVLIDALVVTVQCSGICMDLSGDDVTDALDLMVAVAACGRSTSPGEDAEILPCIDRGFCHDHRVDSFDLVAWDWALGHCDRPGASGCGNLCGRDGMEVPLFPDATAAGRSIAVSAAAMDASVVPDAPRALTSPPPWTPMPWGPILTEPNDKLVILAKKSARKGYMAELTFDDHLSAYDHSLNFAGDPNVPRPPNRHNTRLVKDDQGRVYVVNSVCGVLPLDDPCHAVVGPQVVAVSHEPVYDEPATVYVGIQGEFPHVSGRPILDAAFHQGYVYVVPVVVRPDDPGKSSYLAAARLKPGSAPCPIEKLYADPRQVNTAGNPDIGGLREIEVDRHGSVYVLNAFGLNESDCIWKYDADGSATRRSLCPPVIDAGSPVRAPVGLCVSRTDELIVASGWYDKTCPGAAKVYALSVEDLFRKEAHVPCTVIQVSGMHHITDVTVDSDGDFWVLGYDVDDKSAIYDGDAATCPRASLARIRTGDVQVVAEDLSTRQAFLGLPMSVTWIGRFEGATATSGDQVRPYYQDLAARTCDR